MYKKLVNSAARKPRLSLYIPVRKKHRTMDLEGIIPLHLACMDDDCSTLEVLLKSGAYDVEARTKTFGYTPLLVAMSNNSLRSAKLLLSIGANVDARDVFLRTPLMHATSHGSLEMMELLVEQDADIDAVDKDGDTALIVAIVKKHLGALRYLLNRGVCVNSFDHMGFGPLHIAVAFGGVEETEMLINAGADPFPGSDSVQHGAAVSPLGNAVFTGRADVVRFLVESVGLDKCGGDEEGRKQLIVAAQYGHVGVLWALSSSFGGGHRECINFLISRYDRQEKDTADL